MPNCYSNNIGVKSFVSILSYISWRLFTSSDAHLQYVQIEPQQEIPHFSQSHNLNLKDLTPAEVMVDLTNDLSYRLLHYHSLFNRNNYAFSPTALMSVLVALYEGSASRSALELRNVLRLPHNRDVIRIGYRDIHRRLRTYFFEMDNPLKGLSFNKDNITITRDFEIILMFLGYDLSVDMVSSMIPTIAATIPLQSTHSKSAATTKPGTIREAMTAPASALPATTSSPPTTSKAMPTTSTAYITTASSKETITETTTSTTITSTSTLPTPTTTAKTNDQTDRATLEITTVSVANNEATTAEVRKDESTITENVEKVEKASNLNAEFISTFFAEKDPFLRIEQARVSDTLQTPLTSPKVKYLPSTARNTEKIRVPFIRNKRHVFNYKDEDANFYVAFFQPQANHHNFPSITTGDAQTFISAGFPSEYGPNVEHFYTSSATGGIAPTKQNFNTDIISHVFYLNKQQIVHTTFKIYNAVLYYKYFENIKLSALELELNTPEYNLIILLPDTYTDLVVASASLHYGPTLRLMRRELKPRWVQAIIPDFKLHGTIFLTNDLQNLGICNIFEPSRADLRPMSDEKGIYVKHIEQLINVNIRTHPINQLNRNDAQQTHPIQISVNHPFMFFIVDRDLDIAVMAGRVLNPLNVRIQ